MTGRRLRLGALAALALALAGCTIVGEDYARPDLSLPYAHAVTLDAQAA